MAAGWVSGEGASADLHVCPRVRSGLGAASSLGSLLTRPSTRADEVRGEGLRETLQSAAALWPTGTLAVKG